MKKNLLFIFSISLLITACSAPIHLHEGNKTSTKGLSYIQVNTDRLKVISIDGIKAPESSPLGDQVLYIKPGTHTLIGQLNWGTGLGLGHRITKSKNTKKYCFKTKPDTKYSAITKIKKNGDWVIAVEDSGTKNLVGCN